MVAAYSVEKMKEMKIIAVDTSLGTNFLLSACQDATISELRGLIQKGHTSCFPEHESINVGALMVEYDKKQYHVTDSLLIGQIFRKRWNKIHAEVSSESLRAASTSIGPKHIEHEIFVDGRIGSPGAALDDRPLTRHPETLQNAKFKNLGVDKQPFIDEAPVHGSGALVCRAKVSNNCIGTALVRMASQDCLIDQKKLSYPLLSIEALYTQPCSELDAVTRAALSKGALESKSKFRKRCCVEEDEIVVRKRNQVEVDHQIISKSDRDREFSRNNIISSRFIEEPKADRHKEALQKYKQGTDCGDGFSEKPNNVDLLQDTGVSGDSLSLDNCMANGSTVREQSENSLPTNTQEFVSSPDKMRLSSMGFELHHNPLKRAIEEVRSCWAQTRIQSLRE